MRLVASMMVHNELGRYLPQSIAALSEFCDQVAVYDDGSTDGSGAWLSGQKNVSVLVGSDSTFFDHEGQARQRLLEWTLEAEPTHILSIDADEFVADGWAVRDACEGEGMAWTLDMQEVWEIDGDCMCVRTDGGWRPHAVPALYRVPANPDVLRIADRALACGRVPTEIAGQRAQPSGTEILHLGWTNKAERAARHDRYAVADGGKFHASTHLDSIMWPDDRVSLEGRPWPSSMFRRRSWLEGRIAAT